MHRLFDAFAKANKELFLVGGAVRELARGIDFELIDDLDFCTNALPQESLKILKDQQFTTYDVGIEFGTVGAVLYSDTEPGYPKDCQVTTYRSEEYYRRGSRHPQVRYGKTLDQDLKRRDFSINSMAMDATGAFIDPYNGLDDLKNGILRVVGDPHETLAEDPLRILRVGRFIAKLGFHADEELWDACKQRAEHLLDISRERWLQEMTKLLMGAHATDGVEFLAEVRVMGVILPEVMALAEHKAWWSEMLAVLPRAKREPAQRWAAFLYKIGKPGVHVDGQVDRHQKQGAMLFEGIASRFKMDNAMTKRVKAMILSQDKISAYRSDWSDAQVRHLVRDLDPHLEDLIAFQEALNDTEDSKTALESLKQQINTLSERDELRPQLPKAIGKALMREFSIKPGPLVGELKSHLDDLLLDGELSGGQTLDYYINALKQSPPDCLKTSDESITL